MTLHIVIHCSTLGVYNKYRLSFPRHIWWRCPCWIVGITSLVRRELLVHNQKPWAWQERKNESQSIINQLMGNNIKFEQQLQFYHNKWLHGVSHSRQTSPNYISVFTLKFTPVGFNRQFIDSNWWRDRLVKHPIFWKWKQLKITNMNHLVSQMNGNQLPTLNLEIG